MTHWNFIMTEEGGKLLVFTGKRYEEVNPDHPVNAQHKEALEDFRKTVKKN